ncbi:MAG: glycosyltransferase [Bryobacteraceae bacterium]|jgi:glycosyltransferase involved in cell wall biosynthesis
MNPEPRVVLFADSLLEVNGVALTCRILEDFARRRGLPLLVVHAGPETRQFTEGDLRRLSLKPSAFCLRLENDLRFDLLFARHLQLVVESVRAFQADAVHITGANHTGFLGSLAAWRLGLPVVMSWHTNVHEYAGCRLPAWAPRWLRKQVQDWSWRGLALYYRQARLILAPNREIATALERDTGKPVYGMPRGVDCELFHPRKRDRADRTFLVGYVGRLSPEKCVRRLADVAHALLASGIGDFRIVIVGGGSEQAWLAANVPHARLPGVLKGEALARAYANFDVFVFPSETDTYGNAVQEAMASGVPCVVMARGGPASIVDDWVTGRVCRSAEELGAAVVELARRPEIRRRLGEAARRAAESRKWDAVGEIVWDAYRRAFQQHAAARAEARCVA